MADKTDLTVYPRISPRLILVDAPKTEMTMQELVDDTRSWEHIPGNLSYEKIIDASGKEPLGGGVLVGITVKLNDAVVGFAPRPTSVSEGTVTTGDSNGIYLTDISATFEADGVEAGATVINFTDKSVATVLRVISETQMECLPLGNGADNQFDISDEYKVWNIEQVELTGGNLTAVDSDGNDISAVFPTAFTQVVRTSSSSATLSDLDAIQYASYQNSVWIDNTSSTSGTAYPSGNREYPVNNLTDAVAIANEKGFNDLQILKSMTLDSGSDIEGFNIIGASHVNTVVTLDPSAQTEGVHIRSAHVKGTLDGNTEIDDCVVEDLQFFNGHIHSSGLIGEVVLSGGVDAVIANCDTIDPFDPPVIDMGGSGQNLAMPNYSGLINLKNLTSASNFVGIGLNAGRVVLEDTVTDGTVHISGVGELLDSAGDPIQTGTWNGSVTVINALTLFTVEDSVKLNELYKLQGLKAGSPMTVTPTSRTVDDIDLAITGDGETSTTVTRQ